MQHVYNKIFHLLMSDKNKKYFIVDKKRLIIYDIYQNMFCFILLSEVFYTCLA